MKSLASRATLLILLSVLLIPGLEGSEGGGAGEGVEGEGEHGGDGDGHGEDGHGSQEKGGHGGSHEEGDGRPAHTNDTWSSPLREVHLDEHSVYEDLMLKVVGNPKLLDPTIHEGLLHLIFGIRFMSLLLEPRLLSPRIEPNLLGLEFHPTLLNLEAYPWLLSPEMRLQLMGIRLDPRLLSLKLWPKLLSPEINAQLAYIDLRAPRMLESVLEPRVLSPELDLQLMNVRPEARLLFHELKPSVLSPTLRINLLDVRPSAELLTYEVEGGPLSPVIKLSLNKGFDIESENGEFHIVEHPKLTLKDIKKRKKRGTFLAPKTRYERPQLIQKNRSRQIQNIKVPKKVPAKFSWNQLLPSGLKPTRKYFPSPDLKIQQETLSNLNSSKNRRETSQAFVQSIPADTLSETTSGTDTDTSSNSMGLDPDSKLKPSDSQINRNAIEGSRSESFMDRRSQSVLIRSLYPEAKTVPDTQGHVNPYFLNAKEGTFDTWASGSVAKIPSPIRNAHSETQTMEEFKQLPLRGKIKLPPKDLIYLVTKFPDEESARINDTTNVQQFIMRYTIQPELVIRKRPTPPTPTKPGLADILRRGKATRILRKHSFELQDKPLKL